ncbi:MAG: glucose-6-phosphate isomerase [Bacteroidota bacterium]
MLVYDRSGFSSFINDGKRTQLRDQAIAAHQTTLDGSGAGSDMLGWRSMLRPPNDNLIGRIQRLATEIREKADVLVCVGIGGSYLGAEAVNRALGAYFPTEGPEVIFAGHHISPTYHQELLAYLQGKSVYVNVISKSGTTLEPMLAFRFLRQFMEDTFRDHASRIIATTDADKGQLRMLADQKGYRTFVIPDDVGGRFSVLTPVGLLPIAVAGHDIAALMDGAAAQLVDLADADANEAIAYALDRYVLHEAGYRTEILAVFEPKLRGIGAWWQQLFGESEGKEHKGLFPVSVQYSTDLHSLGQYVQEGQRTLVETFLLVHSGGERAEASLTVPEIPGNFDKLNYLAGKDYSAVNRAAYEGTQKAHTDGGVPNCTVAMKRLDARHLGALLYFFEHAVSVSGYLLNVNPFNQPGVEAYKQEMFRRLGRP